MKRDFLRRCADLSPRRVSRRSSTARVELKASRREGRVETSLAGEEILGACSSRSPRRARGSRSKRGCFSFGGHAIDLPMAKSSQLNRGEPLERHREGHLRLCVDAVIFRTHADERLADFREGRDHPGHQWPQRRRTSGAGVDRSLHHRGEARRRRGQEARLHWRLREQHGARRFVEAARSFSSSSFGSRHPKVSSRRRQSKSSPASGSRSRRIRARRSKARTWSSPGRLDEHGSGSRERRTVASALQGYLRRRRVACEAVAKQSAIVLALACPRTVARRSPPRSSTVRSRWSSTRPRIGCMCRRRCSSYCFCAERLSIASSRASIAAYV